MNLGLGRKATRSSTSKTEDGAQSNTREADAAELNKRQWLPDRCEEESAAIVAACASVVVDICGTITITGQGGKEGQNNKLSAQPYTTSTTLQAYNNDVA